MTDQYSSGVLSHDIPSELHRLRLLEAQLDPVTTAVISARELPARARCLEMGAGAGSVTRWLTERFPDGQVTAVDIDARYLDAGWAPNLKLLEGDIRELDFAEGSFDLIHARTLLMHLPEREEIIARAASWLAPGGWLVVEDVAMFPGRTSPDPLWRKVMDSVAVLIEGQGADLDWVRRRQPSALADAGLAEVGLALEIFTVGDGGAAEQFWRAFVAQLGPVLAERGLLTGEELEGVLELFDDPRFVDAGEALVSAWGRRP